MVKTYNLLKNEEWLISCIETNDGYLFIGCIWDKGALILKTDFLGDSLWSKVFWYTHDAYEFNCVISTYSGFYILTETHAWFGPWVWGIEGKIFALDTNGNEIWSKTIVSADFGDEYVGINSVIQAKDSSYILSGTKFGGFFVAKLGGNSITDLEQSNENITNNFSLFQNYPNPFNPKTVIRYALPVTSHIDLSIYNILGQKVATLVNKKQPAGSYQVQWDASGFTSGVYLYRLKTNKGFGHIKKMVLLK